MSAVTIADPDQFAVATIRTPCIDAVQQASSGHPGTPMAMAPVASTLWSGSCGSTPTTRSGRTEGAGDFEANGASTFGWHRHVGVSDAAKAQIAVNG